MTSTRKSARPGVRRWMGLILGGLIVAAPGISAAASSLDLFYERTLMVAADTRCGLLPDDVGSALVAAQVQARGAAMRAGFDKMTIKATQSRAAAKAGSVACTSPDLAMASGRVRAAFDGYARLLRMEYPGDSAMWKADRGSSAVAARWRLFQNVKFGDSRMVFGLAGRKGANAVLALAQFPKSQAPYAANLVLRDDAVTNGPYLDQRGATLASTPLARRLPPVTAQVTFAAEARSTAGLDLLPKDMKSGWAFRFPPEAARAMAQLDPREVVAVDFMFPGDVTRRAYVEVGDFAAGRAFLQYAAK